MGGGVVGDEVAEHHKGQAQQAGDGGQGLLPQALEPAGLNQIHGDGGAGCQGDAGKGGHRGGNQQHQNDADKQIGQPGGVEHQGDDVVRAALRQGLPKEQVGEGADEVAAPRHQQREEGGDDDPPAHLPLIPDAVVLVDHLGQAPGAKAGHQHRGNQGQGRGAGQGRHLVALHVGHHVGEPLGEPAHLGGLHHQHNQGSHAHHHDEALDKVRL